MTDPNYRLHYIRMSITCLGFVAVLGDVQSAHEVFVLIGAMSIVAAIVFEIIHIRDR